MKVSLKSITPNAEVNIVEIARVSSSRTDKTEKPEGLINYLINNKHWSPFQHSYLTFEVTTSKAIGIQLLRHLSFTFQEFSQRYAKVENIEPIEFRLQAEKNRQSSTSIVGKITMKNDPKSSIIIEMGEDYPVGEDGPMSEFLHRVALHLRETRNLYNEGLELGIAKECMRMILPMATETTIYMTGSVRSWIHFLAIRDDGHAQKEAQVIAKEIKKLFVKELPIISKALGYTGTEDIAASLVDKINADPALKNTAWTDKPYNPDESVRASLITPKEYSVWMSGFMCQGMDSPARASYVGTVVARSFAEACEKLYTKEDGTVDQLFNRERLSYWGCGLYDNYDDAAKSFG
jgi:thymidylate synthase (FAD)